MKLITLLLFFSTIWSDCWAVGISQDAINNQSNLQPGAVFHVSSGTVAGPLTVNGTLTASSGISSTGTITSSSGTINGNLTVTGHFAASGPVTLGDATSDPVTIAGDITMNSNLNVGGATFTATTIVYPGVVTLTSNAADPLWNMTWNSINSDNFLRMQRAGSNRFLFTTSGLSIADASGNNVSLSGGSGADSYFNNRVLGVGSNAGFDTTHKFHVIGSARVNGNLISNGIITGTLAGDSTSYIQNTGTLQASSTFYVSSGTIDTAGVRFSAFSNCNLDTDASGNLVCGSDATGGGGLPLPEGATNYIQNTNSLQSASTFYVSSASVNGQALFARTSGNVGIGTAAPESMLHVSSAMATAASYLFKLTSGTASGVSDDVLSVQKNGATVIRSSLTVQALTDDMARFQSGTTAPAINILRDDVTGGGASNAAILNFGTTNDGILWNIGMDVSSGGDQDFYIFENGASARLFIKLTTGNVGIGTTAPAELFHVHNGTAAYNSGAGICRLFTANDGTCPAGSTSVETGATASLCAQCD